MLYVIGTQSHYSYKDVLEWINVLLKFCMRRDWVLKVLDLFPLQLNCTNFWLTFFTTFVMKRYSQFFHCATCYGVVVTKKVELVLVLFSQNYFLCCYLSFRFSLKTLEFLKLEMTAAYKVFELCCISSV